MPKRIEEGQFAWLMKARELSWSQLMTFKCQYFIDFRTFFLLHISCIMNQQ